MPLDLTTLYFHQCSTATAAKMAALRRQYIALGEALHWLPSCRSTDLALMHLEDSLMRAIQALAVSEGVLVQPVHDTQEEEA